MVWSILIRSHLLIVSGQPASKDYFRRENCLTLAYSSESRIPSRPDTRSVAVNQMTFRYKISDFHSAPPSSLRPSLSQPREQRTFLLARCTPAGFARKRVWLERLSHLILIHVWCYTQVCSEFLSLRGKMLHNHFQKIVRHGKVMYRGQVIYWVMGSVHVMF